jgi:hypothetical protein
VTEPAADVFEQLHVGLAVSLIATPKSAFVTCRRDEPLSDVVARNTEKFDHMPVVDSTTNTIIGVVPLSAYYDAPSPAGTIADHMARLSEHHLIGANASILSFVLSADERPFRLVVSDSGIVGLVSLSDIQALPVRACLFSLVTGLELTMSRTIDVTFGASDDWKASLSEARQEKLKGEIERATRAGGIVSQLLFTQFADKITILKKSVFKDRPDKPETVRQLQAIEALRNRMAHANDYAPDNSRATRVCAQVRDIIRIRNLLRSIVV